VTMKNAVFWNVEPSRSCVNRSFGGTSRLHLQGRKIRERGTSVSRCLHSTRKTAFFVDFSCLNHVVPSGPCNISVNIVDAMFGLKLPKLENRLCANIDLFAVLKCDYSQSL
jgi:hypothetical protein